MRQKIKIIIASLALLGSVVAFALPMLGSTASAIDAKDCPYGTTTQSVQYSNQAKPSSVTVCASADQCKSKGGCLSQSAFVKDMQDIVNALAAGVGVIVTGTIIVGGIQYIIGGDNSGQVEAAKKRITNGIFALVAFFLLYAFLQWIIPGGIFG